MHATRTLARPLRQGRAMSSLAENVKASITSLKDSTAGPFTPAYPVAQFQSDLAAGKVDVSKMQEALKFSSGGSKMAVKMNSEINMAAVAPTVTPPDWEAFKVKTEDPEMVEEIKKLFDAEMASDTFDKEVQAALEAEQAKIKEIFTGLKAQAATEEKATDAALLQCIADLELLETQIGGIKDQTIAEILEQEPELRKELEAEIDANNWAP